MHVNDLANAVLFLVENYNDENIINVGVGVDISIKELAEMICEIINSQGDIVFDETKPDGTPQKLLDISKIKKTWMVPQIILTLRYKEYV